MPALEHEIKAVLVHEEGLGLMGRDRSGLFGLRFAGGYCEEHCRILADKACLFIPDFFCYRLLPSFP